MRYDAGRTVRRAIRRRRWRGLARDLAFIGVLGAVAMAFAYVAARMQLGP